jgi:hypothetical protein
VSHANALLSDKGRLLLARRVVDDGWNLRRAASSLSCSPDPHAIVVQKFADGVLANVAPRLHASSARTATGCWSSHGDIPRRLAGCCPLDLRGIERRRIATKPQAGLEPRDHGDLVVTQGEIEHIDVLVGPLGAGRLGYHDESTLQMPAQDDLGGRLSVLLGDVTQHGTGEVRSLAEGAVGLDGNAAGQGVLSQLRLLETRVQFDLVHGRDDVALGFEALEVRLQEVRHPDGSHGTVRIELLECLPAVDEEPVTRVRPMDEVEIDDVDPEVPATVVECPQGALEALVGIPQLGRDEDLLARNPAEPHRLADTGFVGVRRRRVDVAVAGIQGALRCAPHLGRGDLKDTKAQLGNFHGIVEDN